MTIDREQVLDRLRDREAELRRRGVLHAALFGSMARGEAGPDSDIDIMVEIEPAHPMGRWEYAAMAGSISGLLHVKVDVAERKSLKPLVRPSAKRDAIYAF